MSYDKDSISQRNSSEIFSIKKSNSFPREDYSFQLFFVIVWNDVAASTATNAILSPTKSFMTHLVH